MKQMNGERNKRELRNYLRNLKKTFKYDYAQDRENGSSQSEISVNGSSEETSLTTTSFYCPLDRLFRFLENVDFCSIKSFVILALALFFVLVLYFMTTKATKPAQSAKSSVFVILTSKRIQIDL
jgi:cbb3-type cytochrome oxidase subunit 3